MTDDPGQSFPPGPTHQTIIIDTSSTTITTTGNNNNKHDNHTAPTPHETAANSPTHNLATQYQRPSCCCGHDACAFRKQNQHALEDLERDVRTAAQLGQALLERHETYVAESSSERTKMLAQIASLEADKQSLELQNSNAINENRLLLDQLEAVNNAVSESDTRVTGLQATLISTQQELHRLATLAARTARLEQQLSDFEQERTTWQVALTTSEESEKMAMRRLQQADRDMINLQEQLDRIEQDGREEQQRHAEIIARMERRHAVESELTTAATRLKGAVALKSGSAENPGTSVVSHFVKDILQDNANLQLGIVELREMLRSSNDEVETLRERLATKAAVEPRSPTQDTTPKQKTLRNELDHATSQELHVHHHYHAPPPSATTKQPVIRRKKKRHGTMTGHSSGYSTPRTSVSYVSQSPIATILQQTAVTVPHALHTNGKRWSAHSQHTLSSISGPSSPRSTTNRTSSLYDRVFSDAGHESSRPTTPDSEIYDLAISNAAGASRRASIASARTKSAPLVHRYAGRGPNQQSLGSIADVDLDADLTADILPAGDDYGLDTRPIPEEVELEATWEDSSLADAEVASCVGSSLATDLPTPLDIPDLYQPRMRRVQSHESLFSVAGMDVHTLKCRPSQLLTPYAGRSITSNPVLGDTQAHVLHTTDFSRPLDSGRNMLHGMAIERKASGSRPSLGQKVGGWVFGRWGTSPLPTTTGDDASITSDPASKQSTEDGATIQSTASPLLPRKIIVKHRSPGINQPGPISGFLPEVRTPVSPPVLKILDNEALRNALGSAN